MALKPPKPREWADVALDFESSTGIRVGKPIVSIDVPTPDDELDFLDNDAWEGRDEKLVACLDKEVFAHLNALLSEWVTRQSSRPISRKPKSVFVDMRDEAARSVSEVSELAREALGAGGLKDVLDDEEMLALSVVAEIGQRGSQSLLGRPQELHVSALKNLMAILGRLRCSDDSPLSDRDMANLVSLVCSSLLRMEHDDVFESVRKHRQSYELQVFINLEVQKVILYHAIDRKPPLRDFIAIQHVWPGIDITVIPSKSIPGRWRRTYRRKKKAK